MGVCPALQVLDNSPFTFVSRFEKDAAKTNPEELIGAAHAGCFSMFLGAVLEGDKTPAKSIKTTAEVPPFFFARWQCVRCREKLLRLFTLTKNGLTFTLTRVFL